jgi:hypothetical protein
MSLSESGATADRQSGQSGRDGPNELSEALDIDTTGNADEADTGAAGNADAAGNAVQVAVGNLVGLDLREVTHELRFPSWLQMSLNSLGRLDRGSTVSRSGRFNGRLMPDETGHEFS